MQEAKNTKQFPLSTNAMAGFEAGADATCESIPTSPAWYAWMAGQLLAKEGTHRPIRAKMGRGYSVTVEFFNKQRTTVKFDDNDYPSIA